MPRLLYAPRPLAVVAGDPAIATALERTVAGVAIPIVTAVGGLSASSVIRRRQPRALLVDVDDCPREELALLCLTGAAPPMVLISAAPPEEVARTQEACQAVAALRKPVERETLVRVLRAVVGQPERAIAHEMMRATAVAHDPALHEIRCRVCRWLLYLGAPDLRNGFLMGTARGGAIVCPACNGTTVMAALARAARVIA